MGAGEATTLRALLDRSGPLSPTRTLAIVRQIAAELDLAHAERVAVRDVVAPANIVLSGADLAYLGNTGATGADDTATEITALAYVAPERLTHNAPISAGTDVYALTCVLFECLTGSPPYPAGNDIETLIAAHQDAPIPRPSQLRPGLPRGLDDVIARGLAKDPANRYSSAGALADAAQQALSTPAAGVESSQPHPPVTGEPPQSFSAPLASAPTVAGTSGGLVAISTVVLALLLGGYHGWQAVRMWRLATWYRDGVTGVAVRALTGTHQLFVEATLAGIAAAALILGAALLLGCRPIGRACLLAGCVTTIGYAGLNAMVTATLVNFWTEIGGADSPETITSYHQSRPTLVVLSVLASVLLAVLVLLPAARRWRARKSQYR